MLTLVFGVMMVRFLVAGLGSDAFGLWGLLLSTAGIAGLFREIVRYALNRELAESFHHADKQRFTDTFAAAYRVCAVLAVIASSIFVLLAVLVPVFEVPEHLVAPARVALLARGAYTVTILALTPSINMLIVSERMSLYNAWMSTERSIPLITAVVLFPIMGITDPGLGLAMFGVWSSVGMIAVAVLAAMLSVFKDRRLVPTLRRTTRQAVRAIASTGGWNSLVVLALNLHLRLDQILMNLFFGLPGNAVFTVATQLTSYARMATVGMTDGLDAVAARLTSSPNDTESIKHVVRHSTRLHAFVALPAAATVMLLADQLLNLWVGSRLEDPDSMIPLVANTVRVLAVGIAARSISDGWTRLLYGSGHVSKYAPLLAVGGLLNPIIAMGIIFAGRAGLLPESIGYYGPAIAFSAIFVVVHLFLLARVGARCFEQSTGQFLLPIIRPAIATALALPALIVPGIVFPNSDLLTCVVGIPAFGLAFAPISWFVILDREERARFGNAIRRLAKRGRK